MIDPDVRAIRRKRRQEGRCILCSVRVPRAALCQVCRKNRRYCPRCECIWTYRGTSATSAAAGRATQYCWQCVNAEQRGTTRTRAAYRASQAERWRPRVPAIVRLCKRGLCYREIAKRLGINYNTLKTTIRMAREAGIWPDVEKRRAV